MTESYTIKAFKMLLFAYLRCRHEHPEVDEEFEYVARAHSSGTIRIKSAKALKHIYENAYGIKIPDNNIYDAWFIIEGSLPELNGRDILRLDIEYLSFWLPNKGICLEGTADRLPNILRSYSNSTGFHFVKYDPAILHEDMTGELDLACAPFILSMYNYLIDTYHIPLKKVFDVNICKT